jgi:hypothetical protein
VPGNRSNPRVQIFPPEYGGPNSAVVIVADCNLKGAGFDFRVMLEISPYENKEIGQTNLGKEANMSRNSETKGLNSTRLFRQYLLLEYLGTNALYNDGVFETFML